MMYSSVPEDHLHIHCMQVLPRLAETLGHSGQDLPQAVLGHDAVKLVQVCHIPQISMHLSLQAHVTLGHYLILLLRNSTESRISHLSSLLLSSHSSLLLHLRPQLIYGLLCTRLLQATLIHLRTSRPHGLLLVCRQRSSLLSSSVKRTALAHGGKLPSLLSKPL